MLSKNIVSEFYKMGFPGDTVVKNPAAGADTVPGVGRSPGEGNGSPLQYSCLENPMDREAWQEPVNTTLVGKRDFPDVIKLRVLRWGDYSR